MNPFDMMKKANKMKKDMKRIQKDLEKKTAEATEGGVTVVARGDMSIVEVRIDSEKIDTANTKKLQKQITSASNSALKSVQKEAAAAMSSLTGGLGGLGDMLGG